MTDVANAELLALQASGSAGGVTFSHNQHGTYTRPRTTPADPNTVFQQAVRAAMSQCVTAWNATLTQTERESWERYALAVLLSSPLGRRTHVGGLGMYVRTNVPRLQAAEVTLPRADVAPPFLDLGPHTPVTRVVLNVVADTIHPFFTESDPWTTENAAAILFWASPAKSPAVNFYKGPYRYAGPILGDPAPAPTSPATIPIPFPAAPGDRVFIRYRVTRADGRLSSSVRLPADHLPQIPPLCIKVRAHSIFPNLQTDLTFDQLLEGHSLDPTAWAVRWTNRMWPTLTATVDRDTVRLIGTRGILRVAPNFVAYNAAPLDLAALLTSVPAVAFNKTIPFG